MQTGEKGLKFNERYEQYLRLFDNRLNEFLIDIKQKTIPALFNGIKYSIKNGGKRIRPVLCLAVSDILNIDLKRASYFALAVELIHSYSLVHDDLPAMDNDDYRRGKLSTHKKFGEANGILIGDGLLNLAFEEMLSIPDISANELSAVRLIAEKAGAFGMIKGQYLDLNKCTDSEDMLLLIDEYKTSMLIEAAILSVSLISGGRFYKELSEYSKNLGLMFQFTDDILDVEGDFSLLGKSVKKDDSENKLTAVRVYGLENAKKENRKFFEKCLNSLNSIDNSEFLKELTENLFNRNK